MNSFFSPAIYNSLLNLFWYSTALSLFSAQGFIVKFYVHKLLGLVLLKVKKMYKEEVYSDAVIPSHNAFFLNFFLRFYF